MTIALTSLLYCGMGISLGFAAVGTEQAPHRCGGEVGVKVQGRLNVWCIEHLGGESPYIHVLRRLVSNRARAATESQ